MSAVKTPFTACGVINVLVEQIADTVSDPADIDAEIVYLLNAVS
jgi:hypothetical protein